MKIANVAVGILLSLAVSLASAGDLPTHDIDEAVLQSISSPALDTDALDQELQDAGLIPPEPAAEAPAACCKICRKGKACGDSCINKNYTCHKPPGCAWNG